MYKRILAICGTAILVIAIALFLIPRVPLYGSLIIKWLEPEPQYVIAPPPEWVLGPLGECRKAVSVTTTYTSQIMSESDTQVINAAIVNSSKLPCECKVELYASGFTIAPDRAEQVVLLAPSESSKVNWIITPSKVGNFEMFVSAGSRPVVGQSSGGDQKEYSYAYIEGSGVINVRVTNILGLSAAQARLLSLIGSFLGPALTLPWWYEKWQERKKSVPS